MVFADYTLAAHNERQATQRFIEDDMRDLLVQLAELGGNHRTGLGDLQHVVYTALALHLSDLGTKPAPDAREVNGKHHRAGD
jgi:hypothetical protein